MEIGENGILPGYPRLIKDDWKGLPDNIDAAVTMPDIRKKNSKDFIYIFKVCFSFKN